MSAAIHIADQVGLAGLSMRRLGTALGVEAMSLYRYVPGKGELLDAMAEQLTELFGADAKAPVTAEDGWQDFVRRLALGVRRTALSHPRSFSTILIQAPEAPGLRPPLSSPRWATLFLDVLRDHGFTDDASVAAYRRFTSFLVGHLLLEIVDLGLDAPPVVAAQAAEKLLPWPTVLRLQEDLAGGRPASEFDRDLTALIEGFALTLADCSPAENRRHA